MRNKPKAPLTDEEYFVWRRAFRAGAVRRSDLISAFNCAETTATNVLKRVRENSAGLLLKKGYSVVPAPWAKNQPPKWAGEADLLLQLERRQHNPEHTSVVRHRESDISPYTGLRFDELPVIYNDWLKLKIVKDGTLWAVSAAIRDTHALLIEYTGLRKHQSRNWRRILPLSLHRTAEAWRVYAHDLEANDFPIRTFKLHRISNYERDDDSLPKSLRVANPLPAERIHTVEWNPSLNDDQKQVLSAEFGVENHRLTLSSVSSYEFKLRYEGQSVGDIAWPPFALIKENK